MTVPINSINTQGAHMTFPDDLKYTDTHEWVRIEGSIAVVGITDFAQGELGDVVYIDIPELRGVTKG